jgi:UDP-3-O-[3-hydroxymyristoyl] N-acetylglucosamine deacetylase
MFQSTIKKHVVLEGIGVHSGMKTQVTLHPAPVNTGILFQPANRDLASGIKGHIDNLLYTKNAITVGSSDFAVNTIEHFMAVFSVFGITNLYVKVDGVELPILDGSAKQIVEAIDDAGILMQNAFREIFYIPYPIWIETEGRYLIVLPSKDFKITYTIDFTSKSRAIGTQTAHFIIEKEVFKQSIAPARTFGFVEDLEHLKSRKLALGGSMDNALAYTRERLINDNLRFDNECVRHKVLDLIGDLSLLGSTINGHFIAHKAGHFMDMELLKKIDCVMRRKKTSRNIFRHVVKKRENAFRNFKRKMNL